MISERKNNLVGYRGTLNVSGHACCKRTGGLCPTSLHLHVHVYVDIMPAELAISFGGIFEVWDTLALFRIWDQNIDSGHVQALNRHTSRGEFYAKLSNIHAQRNIPALPNQNFTNLVHMTNTPPSLMRHRHLLRLRLRLLLLLLLHRLPLLLRRLLLQRILA